MLAALAAGGVLGAPPAIGAASPAGLSACSSRRGVLVAVDFTHWHKPVDLGCAPGRPANGLDAMHAAGYLTADDEEDGPGFVCRIGIGSEGVASERPTPAEDPCVSTPPATAYWAFYVADAGQSTWSYSPSGVAAYNPPPGSIEGWAFGSGGQPSVTPAQVRAEASPPTTTTTSTTAPAPSTTSSTVASTTTVPSTVPPTTQSRRRSTTTTTSTTASSTTATTSRIVAVGTGPGARPRSGSAGSSTGVVVTVALVAVLGGAGGAFAWRRRQAA